MEAMERVVEAARQAIAEWDSDGEMDVSPVRAALAALDAIPAPEPQPAGDVVEVRAVVLASGDGNWTVFGSDTCDDMDHAERRIRHAFVTTGEDRVAIITARVPLPTVPTIPATVEDAR
jgi:hypothetical protein